MSINRRTLIKHCAIVVAGVSLARVPFITGGAPPKKIIIISAGIAGLSAGYELKQRGHQVTIFEAQAHGCRGR